MQKKININNIKKIAIISDTHDNVSTLSKAITYINSQKDINLIIHAGDCVSSSILQLLKNTNKLIIYVFGNCDLDKDSLKNIIDKKSGFINASPFVIYINNKKFLITHDLVRAEHRLLKEEPEIIIHGHTHIAEIIQSTCLSINPGECSGLFYGKPTIATLDMNTLKAELISL
jgi:putative phosphoesterase